MGMKCCWNSLFANVWFCFSLHFAQTFLRSSDDMEMCSLKVLQPEGSPSRMLLRLMGERGCTTGHLIDYLQTLGNSEALQCLKPSGTIHWSFFSVFFFLHLQCFARAVYRRYNNIQTCHWKHGSISRWVWDGVNSNCLNVQPCRSSFSPSLSLSCLAATCASAATLWANLQCSTSGSRPRMRWAVTNPINMQNINPAWPNRPYCIWRAQKHKP